MTASTALHGAPMDGLDRLANDAFAGRVVRKDLVRQVKVGANVPVYVLEFLLGKYCASDDPAAIATGLAVVNQTLQENFIRPDESEKAKAELKRKGKHRLIDKVDVRLVPSEDKFWAHLANFGDKYVNIPEDVVYKYDRLLGGGVWCQLDLVYNVSDDEAQKRPFYIRALKPIQVAAFDMDEYVAGRARFSRDEWLDLVMRSIGLEPAHFDLRGKLLAVHATRADGRAQLQPDRARPLGHRQVVRLPGDLTERDAHLRRQGHRRPAVREPQLGPDRAARHVGRRRVRRGRRARDVRLDRHQHAQGLHGVRIVRPRARRRRPPRRQSCFVGNTSKPHEELVRTAHLFADLPKAMIDPAFLDRLHYYLPGWEVPKLEQRLFTDHFGFVSDYFAEALRQLRKQTFVGAIDEDFALGAHLSARDEKAVRKTVSGLLKILHPHGAMDSRRAARVPRVRDGRPTASQGAAQEARRARLREDGVLLRRARHRPRGVGRGTRANR